MDIRGQWEKVEKLSAIEKQCQAMLLTQGQYPMHSAAANQQFTDRHFALNNSIEAQIHPLCSQIHEQQLNMLDLTEQLHNLKVERQKEKMSSVIHTSFFVSGMTENSPVWRWKMELLSMEQIQHDRPNDERCGVVHDINYNCVVTKPQTNVETLGFWASWNHIHCWIEIALVNDSEGGSYEEHVQIRSDPHLEDISDIGLQMLFNGNRVAEFLDVVWRAIDLQIAPYVSCKSV